MARSKRSRLPSDLYEEATELRNQRGLTEYNRNDLLPEFAQLVEKFRRVSEIDTARLFDEEYARLMLNELERRDDAIVRQLRTDGPGFIIYSYDDHIALGGGQRIRRGEANADQLIRYRKVIETNKIGQDRAYEAQIAWITARQKALEGRSPDTKIKDVIDEAGNPVRPEREEEIAV